MPLALSRNYGSGALPIDLPDALGVALFLLTTFSGSTVAALLVTGASEGRAGVARLLYSSLSRALLVPTLRVGYAATIFT